MGPVIAFLVLAVATASAVLGMVTMTHRRDTPAAGKRPQAPRQLLARLRRTAR
ncbi:MAG: hypothetical protein Q4G40_01715 [Brachybacterium sp.]|nr:hypothetical protein [Brachybacterium sp.]